MKKIVICCILLINIVYSDGFEPSHSCYPPNKPYKPFSFNSQWEVDNYNDSIRRFNNQVEEYRDCINDFVNEQNYAIRMHNSAAESAIEDWNNFIRMNN